jgi:hypothetical protein
VIAALRRWMLGRKLQALSDHERGMKWEHERRDAYTKGFVAGRDTERKHGTCPFCGSAGETMISCTHRS